MSASRWRRLAALVQRDSIPRVDVGAHVEVATESYFLVMQRRAAPVPISSPVHSVEPVPLAVPGLTAVPWAGGAIDARIDPAADLARDETIDLERASLPLVVRPAAAGDRFDPLGMGGQSMPLADFFRGRQVRRQDRPRVPLVCDQHGAIWVVGHRISDRVKVSEKSRRTLGLLWREEGRAEWRDENSNDRTTR
jgi:tRNA(Ile)-lysidine synthase